MSFNSYLESISSIKTKLMVVLTSIAVITIVLTAISIFTFVTIKKTSVDKGNLVNLTQIMADNISASVVFDDKESAMTILNSLKLDQGIRGAFVFLKDYEVYASYLNKANNQKEFIKAVIQEFEKNGISLQQQGSYIDLRNIIVFKPIYFNNKYTATLVVVSSTKQIYTAILEITSILFAVFVIILFMTLIIASKFKENFTKPIYTLIDNIQYTINNSKYDKKITQNRSDEFQILYDGFNSLLETIDQQTNKLQLLASIDPMTKLYNRRYLSDISKQIMEMAKRNKTAISIIMIDIDHFKSINDHYGHNNGDKVIIALSDTMKKLTRASDVVCRYGGEEFIVLVPETSEFGAINVAQKIRMCVESLMIEIDQQQTINFTISCGVSEVDLEKDVDIENAIKNADEALYEAKERGRNRVAAFPKREDS